MGLVSKLLIQLPWILQLLVCSINFYNFMAESVANSVTSTVTSVEAPTTQATIKIIEVPVRWADLEDGAPEEPRASSTLEKKSLAELGVENLTIDENKKINKFLDEPDDSTIKVVTSGNTSYTSGALNQADRDKIIKEFKDGLTQVLISADLLARRFDQQQVNLASNYCEVYLHRIGRARHFGYKGAVFNLLCGDADQMFQ
ncbi:U-box domain-containing protein 4-like [Hibiscus syriacus]|uniref:U-box domain-containing protein 4-like n=1 Tax=Hibiscus syriacus TaxID=106335 RepID=A0A6A3CRQ3_HIBSY|nr:U-box domain-containing protein 4-like [Hibiscus syriacus]